MLAQTANHPSDVDVPFVLANGDIKAGRLNEPITLYLTFVVSPNTASSLALPIDATNLQSTEANASALGASTSSMAQSPDGGTLAPAADHRPSTPIPPTSVQAAGMPHIEDALQGAKEAMTTISLSDTWGVVLERMKWVMDTLSPVAEVRYDLLFPIVGGFERCPQLSPYAKMAYGLLFAIPKVSRTHVRYARGEIFMLFYLNM